MIDQIAGDLRPERRPSTQKIATGFHRNTPINQEGGIDVEQFRDRVDRRPGQHDRHGLPRPDGRLCPVPRPQVRPDLAQREYYQLFAFFNNVDEPELEIATPEELAAPRRDPRPRSTPSTRSSPEAIPTSTTASRRGRRRVDLAFKQAQGAVARVAFDTPRDKRTTEQKRALIELMLADDAVVQGRLRQALATSRAAEPQFVTTMVVRERTKDPRVTHVHLGGDFTRKGDPVTPGVPAVFPPLADASPGTAADRLDLARWLVDRRNPLTARVAVNRIWQAYFGRGLVETDNDFGTQGSPPSHPELLDWLACEFMDSGWSLKPIHRLIVTSATYRQSSRVRAEGQADRSRQPAALAADAAAARRRADPRRGPGVQRAARRARSAARASSRPSPTAS